MNVEVIFIKNLIVDTKFFGVGFSVGFYFTRGLLDIRHREIVPHLAQAPGYGGQLLLAEEGRIAVDWRLDGAVLRLRANLGADATDLPPAAGRILHGTAGPHAAPRSVLVTLETGA